MEISRKDIKAYFVHEEPSDKEGKYRYFVNAHYEREER